MENLLKNFSSEVVLIGVVFNHLCTSGKQLQIAAGYTRCRFEVVTAISMQHFKSSVSFCVILSPVTK